MSASPLFAQHLGKVHQSCQTFLARRGTDWPVQARRWRLTLPSPAPRDPHITERYESEPSSLPFIHSPVDTRFLKRRRRIISPESSEETINGHRSRNPMRPQLAWYGHPRESEEIASSSGSNSSDESFRPSSIASLTPGEHFGRWREPEPETTPTPSAEELPQPTQPTTVPDRQSSRQHRRVFPGLLKKEDTLMSIDPASQPTSGPCE